MQSLDLHEFLSRIWPERLLANELLELRFIDRKGGGIKREFYSSFPAAIRAVKQYNDQKKFDIYFGVSTRLGPGGKKRDCLRTRVVWADLDGKNLAYNFSKPQPDIVVDSGGGLHAYWILNTPILLQVEDRWKEIEAINRGLAAKFGGDIQCADTARILRVPGTFNMKYQPKRPVKAYYDLLDQ